MTGGPDDVRRRDNWTGGYYELSIHLGPPDDDRLERAALTLWEASGLKPRPATPAAFALSEHGVAAVRGTLRVPPRHRVVAMLQADRTDDGDWLDLGVPLGALGDADRRVDGFPFGESAGVPARTWREPLDAWFAGLGLAVADAVPFDHAVIGFEVAGEPASVSDGYVSRLARVDGVLRHVPPRTWDGGVTFG
jgi:hypothetical protein